MSDIATAIQEWQDRHLPASALMRRFAEHNPWQLPISAAAVADTLAMNSLSRILIHKDEVGRSCLLVFSSDETIKAYVEEIKPTGPMHFFSSPGDWVFSVALDGIDVVTLDPATAQQFALSGSSVHALRCVAEAVRVEKALQRLRVGESHDGDIQLVAKYPDYVIAISKSPEGDMALCHAPDVEGRTLAAVFTHDDAAEQALVKMQAHYAPNQVVTMKSAGPQIYRMLAGMRNLDGLVFNFEGPGKAIAFAAGLSEILLAEAEK